MESFDEFLNLFEPIFALAAALLNYRLFGAPLYTYLLSLFVFAFVTGFIRNGSFSLSGTANVVSGSIEAGKAARAARAERAEQKRKSYIGFHPSED